MCRVNTFVNPVACFLYKAKDLSAPPHVEMGRCNVRGKRGHINSSTANHDISHWIVCVPLPKAQAPI
jgi:hypothetical protein